MKEYEKLFVDYARYILGIQDILNDEQWEENLKDLTDLIFLSHMVRESLEEKARQEFLFKLHKWDKAFLNVMEDIKKRHKPIYEYFLRVWKNLLPSLLKNQDKLTP